MEQIYIELIKDDAESEIVHFKNFLEQRTDDLNNIEINHDESYDGQMGLGKFKNSISAAIDYIQNLPHLLKSLFDYSFAFSSDITLKIKSLEISVKYNTQPINQQNFEEFIRLINENISKNNRIVVYGNDNIIVQDISNSSVNIDKK